mgnify:CR=1 FL=1
MKLSRIKVKGVVPDPKYDRLYIPEIGDKVKVICWHGGMCNKWCVNKVFIVTSTTRFSPDTYVCLDTVKYCRAAKRKNYSCVFHISELEMVYDAEEV